MINSHNKARTDKINDTLRYMYVASSPGHSHVFNVTQNTENMGVAWLCNIGNMGVAWRRGYMYICSVLVTY